MLKIISTKLRFMPMSARIPFRYGIAVLERLPHLFVYAEIEIDGRRATGIAADGLAPKWFTKNPESSISDDMADMLIVIEQACSFAQGMESDTVFSWWRQLYDRQKSWADEQGYPPLLSGFGTSLVERAVLDAYCRLTQTTLGKAIRDNTLGIDLGDLHGELQGLNPADLLPAQPHEELIVRHTVGLGDYIEENDIPAEERVNDGLPQSLEACIRAYGLTYFKIKLSGDAVADLNRLLRIADLFDRSGLREFSFTLDGNEQFPDATSFLNFWERFAGMRELAPFLKGMLFVEQPIVRGAALSPETGLVLKNSGNRPPLIIDESDGEIESLEIALDSGYSGTSCKSCKGVIRAIANACLLEYRRRLDPAAELILSGEDLANVGPVALLQDLTVMAQLGISHVERNGHHYFAGLSMYPERIWRQTLEAHGDLYRKHEAGYPTLAIRNGRIQIGSLLNSPYGISFLPDPGLFDSAV